jgi:hypothetical protein
MELGDDFVQTYLDQRKVDAQAQGAFAKTCPPSFFELQRKLEKSSSVECAAEAVRGFHFSTKRLDVVRPQRGELYIFPQRPNQFQMETLSEVAASAAGWGNRKSSEHISQPTIVYCYEIRPRAETAPKTVVAKRNIHYTSQPISGMGIECDDSLCWDIVDVKEIVVGPLQFTQRISNLMDMDTNS